MSAVVMIVAPVIMLSPNVNQVIGDFLFIVWALVVSSAIKSYIHELGHIVGGYVLGFRISEMKLGIVVVTSGRITYRFGVREGRSVRLILQAYGHERLRLLMAHASGPLANLASAVIVTIFLTRGQIHGYSEWFLIAFTYTSFFGFAFNMLPQRPSMNSNGIGTDGLRIIQLLFGSDEARRSIARECMGREIDSIALPRDWDRNTISIANDMVSDVNNDYSVYVVLAREQDLGNYNQAKKVADYFVHRATEDGTKRIPVFLAVEIAYLLAAHFGDSRLLQQVQQAPKVNKADLLRLETAQLFSNGDYGAALATGHQAIESIQLQPETGIRRAHAEWMRDLMARAKVRCAEATEADMAAS